MLSPRCTRPRRPVSRTLRLVQSPRSSSSSVRSPRSTLRFARRPSAPRQRSCSASPSPLRSPAQPAWGCLPLGPLGRDAPPQPQPPQQPAGSPGRTPGRRRSKSKCAQARLSAKAALMKKFSSSASAWVSSRPNSTSTPIVPNNNNYSKAVDAMASTPTSRAAAAPAAEPAPSLPQAFAVKCLGWRESRGLWGVKHTRAPVDAMVASARALPAGQSLPRATLHVSAEGVSVDGDLLPIDCISYGVQDLVYTRVFCCVLVSRADAPGPPFRCHAFVCESRAAARGLTYALAAAFQEYSRSVKLKQAAPAPAPRVVDLRTPDDIAAEMLSHCQDSEA